MNTSLRNHQAKLLQHLAKFNQSRSTESGYTLVLAAGVLIILGGMLTTAALVSKIDTASTEATASRNKGFFAAEAGLNERANDIRANFEGFNRPQGNSPGGSGGPNWDSCVQTISPKGSEDFRCEEIKFSGHDVHTYVEDLTGEVPESITIPVHETPFGGLTAQEYRYDLISVAQNDYVTGNADDPFPSAILGMRFKSRLVPLFQFAAFYEEDLDLSFPPLMNVRGPVHSNSSLYINAAYPSGFVTMTGQVTAVGSFYRGEKSLNFCSGTVSIWDGSFLNGTPQVAELDCGAGSRRQEYDTDDLLPWQNTIRTDVSRLNVPPPASFEMPPNGVGGGNIDDQEYEYWNKADLRIVLDLANGSDNPTGISIVNNRGDIDVPATEALHACSVDGATTVLVAEAVDPSGTPDTYEATDVELHVASTANFAVGDRIRIDTNLGGTDMYQDFDSNVIKAVDTTANTITISRQVGHGYQAGNQLPTSGDRIVKSVVTTADTFYNYREKDNKNATSLYATNATDGKFIRMLNVDMGGLLNCIQANPAVEIMTDGRNLDDRTEGGLVMFFGVRGDDSAVDVDDGDTGNNYGVRIYNGALLGAAGGPDIKGLTVITDQAIYIEGDYNLNTPEPWKPAAIIADSLNILSNNWADDDSTGYEYTLDNLPYDPLNSSQPAAPRPVNDRAADDTEVNAAFLSGVDTTGGTSGTDTQDSGFLEWGGGLNNYPRFHQNWEDSCGGGLCELTYNGSMVTLGNAKRVGGKFCAPGGEPCGIYRPPERNWSFDTRFSDAATLPPMTPRAVYLRQEVFQRTFDTATNSVIETPVAVTPSGEFSVRPKVASGSAGGLKLMSASLQPRFRF